jgi:hypothetical protein
MGLFVVKISTSCNGILGGDSLTTYSLRKEEGNEKYMFIENELSPSVASDFAESVRGSGQL